MTSVTSINKFNQIALRMLIASIVSLLLLALLSFNGFGQEKVPVIDSETQSAIIDSVSAALNDIYVFPDVAKNMEKLIRKNLKQGAFIHDMRDFVAL